MSITLNTVTIRLEKTDTDKIKKLAKKENIGHTTLMRNIISNWLWSSADGEWCDFKNIFVYDKEDHPCDGTKYDHNPARVIVDRRRRR